MYSVDDVSDLCGDVALKLYRHDGVMIAISSHISSNTPVTRYGMEVQDSLVDLSSII